MTSEETYLERLRNTSEKARQEVSSWPQWVQDLLRK